MKIIVDKEKIKAHRIATFGDAHGAITECARRLGMKHVQQYQEIEAGKRTDLRASVLYRLAHAFNCRMEDLLTTSASTPAKHSKPS